VGELVGVLEDGEESSVVGLDQVVHYTVAECEGRFEGGSGQVGG